MKLTCPLCGSENELDETTNLDARPRACASCGAALRARGAGEYDGYAVGRRVLKAVPAWLLICITGFVLVLLLFSWASRPVGRSKGAREDEFKNEATNRTPPQQPSPPAARADSKRDAGEDAKGEPPPDAGETGDDSQAASVNEGEGRDVSDAEEEASFSVQAGAFDDHSQANALVSRLRAAGFDARVVEADASKRFRFQVRSGLFRTREDAARLASQLNSKGVAVQTVIVEPRQK